MERVESKAKSTAKRIVDANQKLGELILTAPDKIFKKEREVERRDEAIDATLHKRICSNIIDDQNGRIAIRESREECLREITEHLKWHIFTITGSSPQQQSTERYEYKDWIEALHPDNVSHLENGRSIVDHRFYMKDSHHRKLWNEYMIKLDCRDSMVMEKSRDSL